MVGTNITMRVETMMTMADLRSAVNHYVVKSANVLDRTLRATGTAAQRQVLESLQKWEIRKDEDAHQREQEQEATIVWEKDKIRQKQQEKFQYIIDELNQGKEGRTWELTNRRGNLKEIYPKQESIYYESEETIKDPKDRENMLYTKKNKQGSKEEAIKILQRTGWSPELTYRTDKNRKRKEGEEIFWWKLKWQSGEEQKAKLTIRSKERKDIILSTEELQDEELAIAKTTIRFPEGTNGTWINVLGTKYTQKPTYLERACLEAGLRKLKKVIEEEGKKGKKSSENRIHIEIQSKYWATLTEERLDR